MALKDEIERKIRVALTTEFGQHVSISVSGSRGKYTISLTGVLEDAVSNSAAPGYVVQLGSTEAAESEVLKEYSPEDLQGLARRRGESVASLVSHLALERVRDRQARLDRGSWEEKALTRLSQAEGRP